MTFKWSKRNEQAFYFLVSMVSAALIVDLLLIDIHGCSDAKCMTLNSLFATLGYGYGLE